MGKISFHNRAIGVTPKNKSEAGFSYIEVIISMVILTIGLLGALSGTTFALLYAQQTEKKTKAKETAGSIVENIFAIRDIQSQDGLAMSGFDAVQIKKTDNAGIFIEGWFPVREGPGADGIYGTADDSCAAGGSCTSATVVIGYDRKIEISDIVSAGVVRKRIINVTVRYRTRGSNYEQETISTIIANLPIN
jgi:type II secretory pathway pseudopilin PulG